MYGATDILKDAVKIDAANPQDLIITVRFDGSVMKVSGIVEGVPTLKLAGNPMARLSGSALNLNTPIADDGTFEFPRVPLGGYTLTTTPATPGAPSQSVVVADRDLTGLKLVVPTQVSFKPRLVTEGNAPSPYSLTVRLNRLTPSSANQQFSLLFSSNGNTATVLPEGEYRVDPESLRAADLLPSGYVLTALSYGSKDIRDGTFKIDASHPEELTAAIRVNGPLYTVSGRIRNASISSSMQLHFSGWEGKRITLGFKAMVSGDGTFIHTQTPPGVYQLIVMGHPFGMTETFISVTDRDVTDIELRLPTMIQIRGRFNGEGILPLPQSVNFPVVLRQESWPQHKPARGARWHVFADDAGRRESPGFTL
jgi:hypothetical protein